MAELYRIHFGVSRSKRYLQAVGLAKLAHEHEVRGEGEDIWHVVSFTDEQIDLMASLYKIAKHLPGPKVHGANVFSVIQYCRAGYYNYRHASKAEKERVRSAGERLKAETGKTL